MGSIGPRTLKERGRPEGAPIGPDYLRFASLRRISARSSLRLNLISSTSLRLDSPESLEAALLDVSKTLTVEDPIIIGFQNELDIEKANLEQYQKKLGHLKRNALNQERARKKRQKLINEQGMIVSYDSVGRPPRIKGSLNIE